MNSDTVHSLDALVKHFTSAKEMLAKHGRINISYEPIKKMKTKKQLGFIFKNLVGFLKEELEKNGDKYTLDQIKEGLYERVDVEEKMVSPFTNKTITIRKTLSKMNPEEACQFIEKVIDYIDNDTFLTLPPSVRYTWLISAKDDEYLEANKYCSQAKDRQPEYLAYVRKQHCIACGHYHSEAHHMRFKGGTGIKSPDCYVMPLCTRCHHVLHANGEYTAYEKLKGFLNGRTMQNFCEMCFKKWSMRK